MQERTLANTCKAPPRSLPLLSTGRPYSIWKVTDLDQASHSLFLFGAAHSDLWKESVGTLVALFSPKVSAASCLPTCRAGPDCAAGAQHMVHVWVWVAGWIGWGLSTESCWPQLV